jgi:hypothetical protein
MHDQNQIEIYEQGITNMPHVTSPFLTPIIIPL